MSTTTQARPRLATTGQAPMWALARIEAGRMLRSPAPWIGIALWAASNAFTLTSAPRWVSSQYMELTASATFLCLGVSMAAAYAFGRERVNVSEEASMPADQRARGPGCSADSHSWVSWRSSSPREPLWLRLRGRPGPRRRTGPDACTPTTPSRSSSSPCSLAAFAVALGAAVVHLVRHPLCRRRSCCS